MGKRYFWIKLKEDFFRDKTIKKLRKIAGGDTYTIIYLKMLLSSVYTDGMIFIDGIEDGIADEIALEIDEKPENVEITLQFLLSAGLAQIVDEDVFLTQLPEMVGSETDSAKRVRKHREAQKALHCNTDVTSMLRECNTELELHTESYTEKNLERDETIFLPTPTLSDVRNYCKEKNSCIDPDRFFHWYSAKNWQGVYNWKMAIDNWEKTERTEEKSTNKSKSSTNRFTRCEQRERTSEEWNDLERKLLNS